MGQPSATKHLKTLEAAVGERLVERHGRASRLTQAGDVVAVHAQRVLDTFEGMHEELRLTAASGLWVAWDMPGHRRAGRQSKDTTVTPRRAAA